MFNLEDTLPQNQIGSVEMPDDLWAFPDELFELPRSNHEDYTSTEWSGSAGAPSQNDVSKGTNRDM